MNEQQIWEQAAANRDAKVESFRRAYVSRIDELTMRIASLEKVLSSQIEHYEDEFKEATKDIVPTWLDDDSRELEHLLG